MQIIHAGVEWVLIINNEGDILSTNKNKNYTTALNQLGRKETNFPDYFAIYSSTKSL